MGLLTGLLLLPVTGPVRGFEAILKAIQAEVEAEMPDQEKIQASLIDLQLKHSTGEISEEEYKAKQIEILEQLNELRSEPEPVEAQSGVRRSAP